MFNIKELETILHRYLSCAEFRRTGCRERATILLSNDVDNLRVTQAHNHPPDMWAMERLTFLTALKSAVRTMETATMKKVYETVAENFPVSAMEISFPSIKSTLHRWRKDPKL
ncbi:hypothetical protein GWI33_011808 [Rhynchophorus ferrugineus]|uniref:FLYWCH-type domain-containing protein n=1 Tax=Rhynchophorus ferrugineus TaxID=354439 RepID=A0A834M837_RHYFE|nr:hypothetical protein GWI33_011808 [Rhynchophorus ferrugineus]